MNSDTVSRIQIVESLLGVFGVTEDDKIVEKTLYPRDPKRIAAALDRQSRGEVTREIAGTVERLVQRGFDTFVFNNRALAEAVMRRYALQVDFVDHFDGSNFIRRNIGRLAVESGMVEDVSQFYILSHTVSTVRARRAVKRAQSERGAVISRTVQLLNELDKSLNVLSIKLREWYGLHFPELSHHVESHRTYAEIVNSLGGRPNMEMKPLCEIGLEKVQAEAVMSSAQDSMGAPMIPEDLKQIKSLASNLLSLYRYRQELEAHIASIAQEVAPNLSEVANPVLAAKLIEKAGSIEKLAMMPSSTIQIIGAEKALFRAKKSGSRPPKHGLIFQHPYVHSKPRKMRGRHARALAGKLAIAARADAFSGRLLGAELRKELSEMEDARRNPNTK